MPRGQWALISCGVRGSTATLSYRDALGQEQRQVEFGTFDSKTRTISVRSHVDVLRVFQRNLERISSDAGSTVPVFVETTRSCVDIDWEGVIGGAIDLSAGAGAAFVRATRAELVAPMPTCPRLALGERVDEDLDIGALHWDVVKLAAARDRRGLRTGVSVVRADGLPGELRRIGRLPLSHRPNLVMPYGPAASEVTRTSRPPKGVALMGIDTDRPGDAVQAVLDGITAGTIVDLAKKQGHLLAADPGTLVGLNAMEMPSVDQRWWPVTLRQTDTATGDVASGRRLDAELKPVGSDGTPGEGLIVGAALTSGARYRLAVQIGRTYDHTVLTTPPPPVEESLPSRPGGFDLEVGVFGDGMRVEGWSLQPLHLPETGPSGEVSFIVVAPEVDTPSPAGLDLSIRHEGNVAQQFKLTGTVFPEDAVGDGDLRLTLTFRRVEADQSATLGKRALSISGESRSDGAQRLLVWGPTTDHKELNALQINNFVSGFHSILETAFWLDGEPRWLDTYPSGRPSADFEHTIRKLAELGQRLAVAVLTALPPENQRRMFELAHGEGEIVQIVRGDGAAALPWAALYDWELPAAADAPVCLGEHDGAHQGEAYCVKGFWGVRHVVEEVFQSPPRRDEPPYERPAEADAVLVSLDEVNPFTEAVITALRGSSGLRISPFGGDGDELIDRLWDANPRVAMTVLVGHVEPEATAGALGSGKLALRGGQYLSTGAVPARFFRDGTWTPRPGPLVMVLGCTTGPADIGAATTLVSDFLKAGAPWVVGTAAAVTEEMASDLGRTLIAALFEAQSVGQAMRAWRTAVLQSGNPIAFACNAIGDVDTGFIRAAAA